jgi:DnaK suppressor protein
VSTSVPAIRFDDGRRPALELRVAAGGHRVTARSESNDRRAQLTELRVTTAQRLGDLERSFDDIVDAASDVATDDEHDPEGHTIAWERQQVASLLDEARVALAGIDAAVARLDDGTYGTCVSCGREIPAERLDALPATPSCLDCAG